MTSTMEQFAEALIRKKALVVFLETIGGDGISVDTLFVRIFERRQQCINQGIVRELDWMLRSIFPEDSRARLVNYLNQFECVRDMRHAGELGLDLGKLQLPSEPILEFTRWYYMFALSVNAGHAKRKSNDAAQAMTFAKQLEGPSRSEALGALAFYQARYFKPLDDSEATKTAYIESAKYYLNAYEQLVAAHAEHDFCLAIAQVVANLRAWWGYYCAIETINQCPISGEQVQTLIKTYGQEILAFSFATE